MGSEKGPDLVVVAFVRGRWSWLRVEDELTIAGVSTKASTVTLELDDRRRAKVWSPAEREAAESYAKIVKGHVVRADWAPPSAAVATEKRA